MKISNSQIMDAQRCEKRFYFSQILKLRPKSFPEPMAKGIFGHELFEAAFLAMYEGKSYEECVSECNRLIEANLSEIFKVSIYRHVLAFLARAFQEEWKVVSVEQNFSHPVAVLLGGQTKEIEFVFTPDIVFQWTKGVRANSYFMLDFKFTGQQWNDREVSMYQQLPKYAIYWNKLHPDKPIHHLGVAMLFTRAAQTATGPQLFAIKWLKVTREKLATVERENELLVQRVANLKGSTESHEFLRTVNSHECKMCFFADDLCPADLEGKSIEKYVKLNYEVNTYFEDNYGEDSA